MGTFRTSIPCLSCSRNDKNEMVQLGLLAFLQELVDLNLFSPALLKGPSLINTKPLKVNIQCLKFSLFYLPSGIGEYSTCIYYLKYSDKNKVNVMEQCAKQLSFNL